MNTTSWFWVAFGASLGMIVALRLNTAGLLIVATLLLAALVLAPLLLVRWVRTHTDHEIDVRIERVPLALPPVRRARRGGWTHLQHR